jgi:hypothetical protein
MPLNTQLVMVLACVIHLCVGMGVLEVLSWHACSRQWSPHETATAVSFFLVHHELHETKLACVQEVPRCSTLILE